MKKRILSLVKILDVPVLKCAEGGVLYDILDRF